MKSYWNESTKTDSFNSLNKDISVDVCIIGAGIAGVSCCYNLAKEGLSTCILEEGQIASSVTANTTAKITSQHDLIYDHLIKKFGKEYAKKYLMANESAIGSIKRIIEKENIDCNFEIQDSYIFTKSEKELGRINKEFLALQEIGYSAELVENSPLPFNIIRGIKFKNQAQFHPKKYIYGLVKAIVHNNGKIFEDTKVLDIKKSLNRYTVITENNKVTAKYVIVATHYPIINIPGFYFVKMHQEMSYAILIDTKENLFDGMYISIEEPTLSFRNVTIDSKKFLLVVGFDHRVGIELKDTNPYKDLEKVARDLYPNMEIKYKWSTQDCMPLDKVPYIGDFSSLWPNVYVATGFKKWGMTTSQVAADIIKDKILGNKNEYENVFKATRLNPLSNIKELGNQFKESVNSTIIEKIKIPITTTSDIKPGHGGIVKYNNMKVGIYKDINGNIFGVKPVCTHLGCELNFNNVEKTWDCPCHGSSFSYKGKSLLSPSIKPLKIIQVEEDHE